MLGRTTITSTFVEKLVAYGATRGLPRGEMLAAAGLPADVAFGAEKRVSIGCTMSLWEFLMRRLDDPAVPIHIARTCRIDDYHAYGFAVMTSGNIREALQRTVKYSKVFTSSGAWHIEERGELASATWRRDLPLTLGHRVANENTLAEFVQSFRQVTRSDFCPMRVCFRHPAPSSIEEHLEYFGAPLAFNGASDSLFFPRHWLDAELTGTDPALAAFFERYLDQRLGDDEPPPGWTARVREAVLRDPASGPPSADQIARRLGLGKRTLRRYLEAEGTNYRGIVSAARQEFAERLLHQPGMSVADIAFMLGYSDAGAFSRAFSRWAGVSPRDYRLGISGKRGP